MHQKIRWAAALTLGAAAWKFCRDRKYPLARGCPPLHLFVVPGVLVGPRTAALGNRVLARMPLPPVSPGLRRTRQTARGRDGRKVPADFSFLSLLSGRHKKNLVPSAFRQKGRGIDSRGSTLFEPASLPEPLHFDDNGITGPDWGHSEVVFKCFRDRRLPAYVSLSGTFHILLFSSTCCLSFSILYPTLGLCQPSFSHKNLKQKK